MPQRVDQLGWLGLTAQTVNTLKPYVTLLPERTPINLNTASAEVIHASVPGLDMADATRLVAARERAHFATLADAGRQVPAVNEAVASNQLAVATRFFEVRGRVRLDQSVVEEVSVVQRDGLNVRNDLAGTRSAASASQGCAGLNASRLPAAPLYNAR